jgi:hypothetical protein
MSTVTNLISCMTTLARRASIGAMSDWPTVHTLHGPFTEQTSMLGRRIARRHWFLAISQSQQSMGTANLRWAEVVYNGIPMDRYRFRETRTTTCSSGCAGTAVVGWQ